MSRVLLVDDMIDLLEDESHLLADSDLHCETSCASSSEEALSLLEQYKFDLAIVDLMMPKKNGIELMHEIKRKYHLPVIIYTGYSECFPKQQLIAEGADAVLCKPAPLDLFVNTVKNLLDPQSQTTLIIIQGYKIKEIRNQVLAQMLQKVLDKTSGNVSLASNLMGVSRDCFAHMMKRLNIH